MSYFIEKQNRCFFKLKLVCMTQRFTFANCLINDVCIFLYIYVCSCTFRIDLYKIMTGPPVVQLVEKVFEEGLIDVKYF